MAKKGREIVD